MTSYPGTEKEQRIPEKILRPLVSEIFERCGMSADNAALLADTLVVADLRGCHSHGAILIPEYVRKLTAGGVNPKGNPRVARDSQAALLVDGDNSLGQIAATFAMRRAIERARDTGVAATAVGGSNHCGAMAYFAMLALPEDMIGIATTHALPTMAPWGGIDCILGINPMAVAIPAGEESPIVLDAAFAAAARGKVKVYHQKGIPLPEGWAFDSAGRPTTDTKKALEGLLQPIGQYKGYGFALVMGILSAVLSGALFGTELGDVVNGPKPGRDGHFFIALKVAAFEDVARFKQRTDGIIRQMRSSRRAEGVERIYSPGEVEFESEKLYREEGIPLNRKTLQGISEAAKTVGVDPSPLQG